MCTHALKVRNYDHARCQCKEKCAWNVSWKVKTCARKVKTCECKVKPCTCKVEDMYILEPSVNY